MKTILEHIAKCDCGSIKLTLVGEPKFKAYCHCESCRAFYDVPVLAATAWDPAQVKVLKGQEQLEHYRHPHKALEKYFCRKCGQTIFGSNRLGMTVIRNNLLAKANIGMSPEWYSPVLHIFYAQRQMDIQDELPKYLEGIDGPTI